jgi:hypothetical protein
VHPPLDRKCGEVKTRLKNRLVTGAVSLALVGGASIAAATAASAAPACLAGQSHANNWSITNKCGKTMTYTVIRPGWFDQNVTIKAGETKYHAYSYHGIK